MSVLLLWHFESIRVFFKELSAARQQWITVYNSSEYVAMCVFCSIIAAIKWNQRFKSMFIQTRCRYSQGTYLQRRLKQDRLFVIVVTISNEDSKVLHVTHYQDTCLGAWITYIHYICDNICNRAAIQFEGYCNNPSTLGPGDRHGAWGRETASSVDCSQGWMTCCYVLQVIAFSAD